LSRLNANIYAKWLTRIYFGLTIILIFAEALNSVSILFLFKPLLIPTLIALYFYTSGSRNIFYIISLFFAWSSNLFLLLSTQDFLLYGILAFMFYRTISIYVVLKLIPKLTVLPFAIACLPFIFIFSSLINLTMSSLSTSFYPAIINGVLISALSGIALSNYVMDDNRMSSWLAISTLLFVVLVFLFMIQKYYFPNEIFQPISALIFSTGHYAFYRFVIEAEKCKSSSNNNGFS